MFKFIKKWYFKLYHLFRFLGIIILIFGYKNKVNAIEIIPYQQQYIVSKKSCTDNLMNSTFVNEARLTNGTLGYVNLGTGKSSYLIPIDGTKTYKLKILSTIGGGGVFKFQDENSPATMAIASIGSGNTEITINKINKNGIEYKYLGLYIWSYSWPQDLSNTKIMLNEGNILKEYVDYSESCIEPPPVGNQAYTEFLSLYADRMTYLAGGFTTNDYLIAMIGIIISWVVLELMLKILNLKRGK